MIDAIKKLREKTNAGVVDCKKALAEANGDIEKAIEILRKKGVKLASERSSRATKEGRIESYIHMNGRIGVLVEVNCETDFVARNEEFKKFVKNICMQIAATRPKFVKREDVPEEVLDKEKEIAGTPLKGKPDEVVEKIISGKLEKFFEENCLMEQPFIKDSSIKIKDLLNQFIAKIGENIVIRRFIRYQLGEEL